MKAKSTRYETDQGFQQPHNHQSEIILQLPAYQGQMHSQPLKKDKKHRYYSRKEDPKLKFVSIQRDHSISSHYKSLANEKERITNKSNKSEILQKNDSPPIKKRSKVASYVKRDNFESFKNAVIKPTRTQIGQNLQLKQYNVEQKNAIKQKALAKGSQIVFQTHRESNSHGYFKKLLKLRDHDSFLKSKYNKALLNKLNQSCIFPKTDASRLNRNSENNIEFISDFQCSNMDFVTKINHFEFDVFLKADTNSMGHQNWFYFKVNNNQLKNSNIFINICNLKRSFKMIKKGQKIYYRKKNKGQILQTGIQQQSWTQWERIEQEVTVVLNQDLSKNANGKQKKIYKLSFATTLLAETEYQISLLPPFSYSSMLKQIQELQAKCSYMSVQILSYSLIGLAIPIVTFCLDNEIQDKNVVLISSRIHPGQTCGSFVASGLLKKLVEKDAEVTSFLEKNIVKIIPMINPDGVVLGNFRTNYLGNDLNRSFCRNDETLFPEIIALKNLGEKLTHQYRDRFLCFLDLHGHSSQKNIFSYGPQYEISHRNFMSSRFLPKVLDHLSDQFDYDLCTFKLQEYKCNTARGFFLSSLKVMAFTIESSYALYDSKLQQKTKNIPLRIMNWDKFGKNIIDALRLWSDSFPAASSSSSKKKSLRQEIEKVKSQRQSGLKKQLQNNNSFINKIRKQLRKQSLLPRKSLPKGKGKNKGKGNNSEQSDDSDSEDSDGQSQSQDLPLKERLKLEKKIVQGNSNNLFPRILRPAIVHPEVNPPLFSINKIAAGTKSQSKQKNPRVSNMKMKRHRYNPVKPMNVNNAYTQYLIKEVKGLQSLKPSVNLMKLQRKQSTMFQSYNNNSHLK